LVEDAANPDSTPFLIDASGFVVSGSTASLTDGSIQTFKLDGIGANDFVRKNTAGSGIVLSGETVGNLRFYGFDGASYVRTAQIFSAVDGTPGTNDMPGRLVFSTTADGASSPTERMRITSSGNVGIGGTPAADRTLLLSKNITGATAAYGIVQNGQIQSDVTTLTQIYRSGPSVAAASFTLPLLAHYVATSLSFGVGSTVTDQIGFSAESSLTGATNNYGFYGNIASGTGRWNFYAAGTADNYFAGNEAIGTTTTTVAKFYVSSGNIATDQSVLSRVSSGLAVGSRGFRQLTDGNEAFALYNSNSNVVLTSVNPISIAGTAGAESLRATPVASAVNYLNVQGAITTASPSITAAGSDTNIDITLTPKGTGNVRFGTYTAGILAQAGYITIKDAAGNTRNLLVG
jgi:hypothetical protein